MIRWRPTLLILCSLTATLALTGIWLAMPRTQAIEPSGPFPVERHERVLTTSQGSYRVITWMPGGPIHGPEPLVLYAPGWGNPADDSAALLAELASHGYVTAAFDDVAHDLCSASDAKQDCADRTSELAFDSPAAYRRSFAMASRRIHLAARKGIAVLDALLAAPDLAGRIDRDRIGAVGFSFGGATAVEQSVQDKRIRAVVNLDGWLYGKSASAPPAIPYLLLYIDEDFPPAGWASSHDAEHRALAIGSAFDENVHRRLLANPDFHWIHAHSISHTELSDIALQTTTRQRLGLAPAHKVDMRQFKAAQFAILRAFLDRYLRGQGATFPPSNRTYPGGMTDVRAELD
jgi:dienelactone hydrolase